VSGTSGTPHLATGTAGLPWTTVIERTELVTTLPAVTTAPSPISTFGRMITPGPMKACFPIRTPLRDSLKCAITMTPIPIKASSSIVISSGNSVSRTTLELIQTSLPMRTPRARCSDTRRLWPPGKIIVKIWRILLVALLSKLFFICLALCPILYDIGSAAISTASYLRVIVFVEADRQARRIVLRIVGKTRPA
jgi:hypothetical protein